MFGAWPGVSVPAIAAGMAAARFGLLPVTYAYGLMLMLFAGLALAGTRQPRPVVVS